MMQMIQRLRNLFISSDNIIRLKKDGLHKATHPSSNPYKDKIAFLLGRTYALEYSRDSKIYSK